MIHVIGADFISQLLNFRTLWLSGRFGGGKTATAAILAAWLWWRGYVSDVVANFPLQFANPAPRPPLVNYCLVVDEAWQFARDSAAIFRYAAFMRKRNTYLLLPSVFPINPRLATFWTERVFNAYVIGLPIWVWRWTLQRPSFRDYGYWLIINPHHIFRLYDTYAVSQDDGHIAALLAATAASPSPSPSVTPSPAPPSYHQLPLQPQDNSAEAYTDAASQMMEAADAITEKMSALARLLRRR